MMSTEPEKEAMWQTSQMRHGARRDALFVTRIAVAWISKCAMFHACPIAAAMRNLNSVNWQLPFIELAR